MNIVSTYTADVERMEIFLIGELSIKEMRYISPRGVPHVVAAVRRAVAEYMQEHTLSFSPGVRNEAEKRIISGLIMKCAFPPGIRRAVEDAVEALYANESVS